MPSNSSLLRSPVLLILTSFVVLDSREIPQDNDEAFLENPYRLHIISTPVEAKAGPGEDFAFGTRAIPTFPQVEAAFLMDYKTQATQVWPRLILDYMRHQFRFKGRTKKSTKKGFIQQFTV